MGVLYNQLTIVMALPNYRHTIGNIYLDNISPIEVFALREAN